MEAQQEQREREGERQQTRRTNAAFYGQLLFANLLALFCASWMSIQIVSFIRDNLKRENVIHRKEMLFVRFDLTNGRATEVLLPKNTTTTSVTSLAQLIEDIRALGETAFTPSLNYYVGLDTDGTKLTDSGENIKEDVTDCSTEYMHQLQEFTNRTKTLKEWAQKKGELLSRGDKMLDGIDVLLQTFEASANIPARPAGKAGKSHDEFKRQVNELRRRFDTLATAIDTGLEEHEKAEYKGPILNVQGRPYGKGNEFYHASNPKSHSRSALGGKKTLEEYIRTL